MESKFADEDDTPHASTWSQDRRLKFIDFRLRWEGRINRTDLTSFFDISMPQASADLSKYLEAAPFNLKYDGSLKTYVRSPTFEPIFARSATKTFLNELQAVASGVMEPKSTFIGSMPELGVVPIPARSLDGDALSVLLAGIREHREVSLLYQGMKRPNPVERRISPHALAFDGFRWHVRAFCHLREKFQDFVIARMINVKLGEVSAITGLGDIEWENVVPLVLAAHPALSPTAKKAVQMDYGMVNGTVTLHCRQALLFYALRQLRLEIVEDLSASAKQQIILLNRTQLQTYINSSGQASST